MREILFRGKRIDNGEWVEGFLLKGNRTYIVTQDAIDYMVVSLSCMASMQLVEVDPKTVGEFTGLYTVSEQKIWSDDIARFDEKLYVVQRECDTDGGYWAESGYVLKRIGWNDYISFVDTIDDFYNEICIGIIGNIHDNPELLEVSDNANL